MGGKKVSVIQALLALSPLLTCAALTAEGLLTGRVSGWGVLLLIGEYLAVLAALTGRGADSRLLALGGWSLVAAGIFLTGYLYAETAPPKPEDLTEVRGTVARYRVMGAMPARRDHQLYLEGDDTPYWISGVLRPEGGVKAGDQVSFLCRRKKDGSASIYALTVNRELVLDRETAFQRMRQNQAMSWMMLLAALGGVELLRERSPGRGRAPKRRRKR